MFTELQTLTRDQAKPKPSTVYLVRPKVNCSASRGMYTFQTKSVRHHVTCTPLIVIPHRSAARYQTRQYARKKSYCGFSKSYSRARSNFTSTSVARGCGSLYERRSERPRRPFVRAARWEAFEREARNRRRAAAVFAKLCAPRGTRTFALERPFTGFRAALRRV